ATAFDYMSLWWETSGDGFFADETNPETTYYPDPDDIMNQSAIITLTAESVLPCEDVVQDELNLYILPDVPEVNAGGDATVCGEPWQFNATATDYSFIYWTTSGDGTFDDQEIINPVYTPGPGDLGTGTAEITVEIQSAAPCTAQAMDMVLLSFIDGPVADAGADAAICQNQTHQLNGSASNFSATLWSTTGDGTFDNPDLLHAVYSPGGNDIDNGTALLTLQAYPLAPCTGIVSDQMMLTIQKLPQADAGDDGSVCETQSFDVLGNATLYESVQWTGSGDGAFADPSALATNYIPGPADVATGSVILTLSALPISPCVVSADDQLMLQIMRCHDLILPAGWSGISSWVNPTDTDLETLLAPAIDNLIIIRNPEGFYWPIQSINTLVEWDNSSGYVIKMSDEATLNFIGTGFANNLLQLDSGWSLIPVLSPCEVDVAELTNGTNLVMIKEAVGINLYWPQFGLNTLIDLEPGSAYYVLMSEPSELTFPVCDGNRLLNTKAAVQANESSWVLSDATALTHIIGISSGLLSDLNIENGDHIGAFGENGSCYGSAKFSGENLAITLFGNDPMTIDKDGFDEDELILFRHYSHSSHQESELSVTFNPGYPDYDGKFSTHGISVIKEVIVQSNGIPDGSVSAHFQIYPNPANNELFIICGDYADCRLELLSMDGILLKTVFMETEKTKIDISDLAPGVYVVKNSVFGKTLMKKVVKY
nr:T9SS type A sorting domain-containing protein [Bacteroidota bacterium]